MTVNDKFPVLSTFAKIVWVFGIILSIIGAILLSLELLELMKLSKPGSEWVWATKDYVKISCGILSLIFGISAMIISEVVGVLFAIEKNTRLN